MGCCSSIVDWVQCWYLILHVSVSSSAEQTQRVWLVGRQGPLSQPWVYDNSNSIELAGPGLWDLLLVCVCASEWECVLVIRQPDPPGSLLGSEWISDQGLYHRSWVCVFTYACLCGFTFSLLPFLVYFPLSFLFPFFLLPWFPLLSSLSILKGHFYHLCIGLPRSISQKSSIWLSFFFSSAR